MGYKLQDANFFKEVNKLLIKWFDPKHDLMNEHVTTTDITKVFCNIKTYKSTNSLFTKETNKEIETFYWKINGKGHTTNIELMVWFVKGWIA